MTTYDPQAVLDREDITPEWLTALLMHHDLLRGAKVSSVSAAAFGTGQVADSLRLSIEYSEANAGPATLVAKVPSTDEASRTFGSQLGLYETEIRFYRELAANLPVSVPRPLHAAIDQTARFTLVMEDLAPAEIVDQLEGASVDRMALAVEHVALLHAATWDDHRLKQLPWLRSVVKGYEKVIDGIGPLTEGFQAKFGDVVPEVDIDQLRALGAAAAPWKERLQEVRCLWHQDYRLDNLLFDAHAGAVPIAVVDWQTVGMANGVIDLPYVVGSGLTIEDRRTHERDLVQIYHDVLVAQGVDGYGAEACWQDYRELAAHGLAGLAVGAVSVQRTERGDEMWRIWASRHAAQTRDLDTFTQLQSRS